MPTLRNLSILNGTMTVSERQDFSSEHLKSNKIDIGGQHLDVLSSVFMVARGTVNQTHSFVFNDYGFNDSTCRLFTMIVDHLIIGISRFFQCRVYTKAYMGTGHA